MLHQEPKEVNGMMGEGIGFERIRRITGYLTGHLEGWSNAKRAEERDRVKHLTLTNKEN